MSITTPHRFVRPRSPKRDRNESGAIWLQMSAALFGGTLLFMAAVFTLSVGYSIVYFGRIFPGVSVAGVDVSGVTAAEAAVKLSNTLTYPYSGRIVFRDGATVWIETPARLGMVFDAPATADRALSFGRSWNLFQNMNDQIHALQAGSDLPPVSIFDERIAHAYLQDLAKKIDRPVTEASLNISGLDVSAQPGQSGRTVNVDSTLVSLNAQLESFRDGEVPVVVAEQAPEIMDSSVQAEAARRLLSAPFILSIPDARPGDPGPWQVKPNELASMLRVGRVVAAGGSQFVLQLEREAIQNVLDQIAQQIDRRSENARFIFDDETGQLDLIQPAIIGLTMDIPGSIEQVESAVAQGQQNVLLDIVANQPQVGDDATAQQLGITENVQTYTSYFRGSSASRLQNIKAAASKFHGLLIAPGATFSMGEYMGDISLDNGFAEAMIIYNGQTIKGVGGGVCQVSTTLFRAAFMAGFPVNERHAHAYRVFYYEQTANGTNPGLAGLDATVYFPLVNFKFTNDTPNWLLMETYFGPNSYSLTWKFYSTKDGRTVSWETTGPQNVVPPPDPVIRMNPEFSDGEIKLVDHAAQGADVVVNRIVMRDGKILFADRFVTQYQPWADVCEYGPGTKDPEKQLKKKGMCQR
jgi:vancomycin resistance protein YoaR